MESKTLGQVLYEAKGTGRMLAWEHQFPDLREQCERMAAAVVLAYEAAKKREQWRPVGDLLKSEHVRSRVLLAVVEDDLGCGEFRKVVIGSMSEEGFVDSDYRQMHDMVIGWQPLPPPPEGK